MKGALPFLAMMVAQVSQVGLTLAGKKAIETGMQNFSYVFYSNALTCLVVGYAGVTYVSATVATAILNLIPGFTFVLAITFGYY
ncbi:hypothetical protein HanHA300_Chr08g0261731 [Helianthus annuus]|nr:hypothetical protein HanHA300_Chr08g0261731 [Helianthus annuus]KAJ0717582.1 hypothetical protein HanLR1_Chr08g0260861 [Helianthus annuus]